MGQWERSAAEVGSSVLIIKLVQGGTYFYMWSECLFGLIEEAGAAVAAVTVAIRPVAVYAFSAVSGRFPDGGGGGGRKSGAWRYNTPILRWMVDVVFFLRPRNSAAIGRYSFRG